MFAKRRMFKVSNKHGQIMMVDLKPNGEAFHFVKGYGIKGPVPDCRDLYDVVHYDPAKFFRKIRGRMSKVKDAIHNAGGNLAGFVLIDPDALKDWEVHVLNKVERHHISLAVALLEQGEYRLVSQVGQRLRATFMDEDLNYIEPYVFDPTEWSYKPVTIKGIAA